jgi:hypothetical protein
MEKSNTHVDKEGNLWYGLRCEVDEISYGDLAIYEDIEEEVIHVFQAYMKFKMKKVRELGNDAFKERYSPVIVYWMRRLANKQRLKVIGGKSEFFTQDGDNIIRDLCTLRITVECEEDAGE